MTTNTLTKIQSNKYNKANKQNINATKPNKQNSTAKFPNLPSHLQTNHFASLNSQET